MLDFFGLPVLRTSASLGGGLLTIFFFLAARRAASLTLLLVDAERLPLRPAASAAALPYVLRGGAGEAVVRTEGESSGGEEMVDVSVRREVRGAEAEAVASIRSADEELRPLSGTVKMVGALRPDGLRVFMAMTMTRRSDDGCEEEQENLNLVKRGLNERRDSSD